jgi:hypothetical protein
MIQCATAVNRDAVRRESIGGIEHVIVSSFTLPDNVVMNGGLYPAEEIEAGFPTLERTLAPVEHPTDSQGNFISASDPEAIHNFHAGAFNVNVSREDGRVHIEKFINVQEALKTDRGRRLLDRIEELETNKDPRPIHTSVGVFINVEETDGVQTNADGSEFTWVARDMVFDHDAILLDSVGAAQPDQGVGMAVNRDGSECEVDRVTLNADDSHPTSDNAPEPRDMRTNQEGMSFTELHEAVIEGLERAAIRFDWIEELFNESVIFRSSEEFFTVPFTLDETTQRVTIVGIPITVERNVTFSPKINSEEGDAMKELILNALAAAGVETDGLDDQALFDAYSQLSANQSEGDGTGAADDKAELAEVVANAMKPLTEKIGELEGKLNAQDTAEHEKLAGIVANSGKFPGLDEEAAKLLPVEKLREMSANCGTAHGIPMTVNSGGAEGESQRTEMPE